MSKTQKQVAEQRTAIESFMDVDEIPKVVVRRTALEQVSTCPAMYSLIRQGKCFDRSELTEVGEAVHQAIALATLEYVESDHAMSRDDLLDEVRNNLRGVRPDIQPKAIQAADRALWSWADYVSRLPARTIIAFDGGDRTSHPDDQSRTRTGQLSWEVSGAGRSDYIVTAELDLLHSTRSPEILCEIDYKSGWKNWDYELVFDSFQFSLHAFLVFKNFQTVNFLDVRIWSTRTNSLTPPVRFNRKDLDSITARLRRSVGDYDMYAGLDNAPAWPYPDKCSICPCALHCPSTNASFSDVAKGPEEAVRKYVALGEALKAQKEALKAYVTITDSDIVIKEEGLAFGRDKPSSERWPADPVYKIGGKESKPKAPKKATAKKEPAEAKAPKKESTRAKKAPKDKA